MPLEQKIEIFPFPLKTGFFHYNVENLWCLLNSIAIQPPTLQTTLPKSLWLLHLYLATFLTSFSHRIAQTNHCSSWSWLFHIQFCWKILQVSICICKLAFMCPISFRDTHLTTYAIPVSKDFTWPMHLTSFPFVAYDEGKCNSIESNANFLTTFSVKLQSTYFY